MEKVYNLLDVDRDQLWNVRIVEKGDSYGRDMCLTYDETDPLVEFYDADASFPVTIIKTKTLAITYWITKFVTHES